MHRLAVLVALSVLAAPAVLGAEAGGLPTLFAVANLEPGDALNVRPTPGTDGAPIDRLPEGTRNVEVVALSADGRWGRINRGEGSGWVHLRYMSEQPEVWTAGAVPATLRCFGTEPFWSAAAEGDSLRVTRLGDVDIVLPVTSAAEAGPRGRDVTAASGAESLTLAVAPAECSDGMSDRVFGLSAVLGLSSGRLHGCCSLQP